MRRTPANSAPTGSQASSPDPNKAKQKAKADASKAPISGSFHMRTEQPAYNHDEVAVLDSHTVDLPATGNLNYTIGLIKHGFIRHSFARNRVYVIPHPIVVNLDNMYIGARNTIRGSLIRLHKRKMIMSNQEFYSRVDEISNALASGCNLVTYMKLRALTLTDVPSRCDWGGLERPRGVTDLPIPTAFAFAIQQLGIVNIADLEYYLKVVPCKPQTGFRFGQPTGTLWNPSTYQEAVEFARNLGMRFAIVDTTVKEGTAWWLFQQDYTEEVFRLTCPYPETNFTEMMTLPHSLYLNNEGANPSNAISDLTGAPHTGNFGIMMQSPHSGINISTFEALSDTANEISAND